MAGLLGFTRLSPSRLASLAMRFSRPAGICHHAVPWNWNDSSVRMTLLSS